MTDRNTTEYTKFKENIEYTVIMPGEYDGKVKYQDSTEQCKNFVLISGLLAALLALSTIIVSSIKLKAIFLLKTLLFSDLHTSNKGSGKQKVCR